MTLFIIFGLIFGSFANAYIYRWPRQLPWVDDRSICPQCKHQLAWYDNIPIISYLLLKGSCRYCHNHIPLTYPAIELGLALIWSTIAIFALHQVNFTGIGPLSLYLPLLLSTIAVLIIAFASLIIIRIDLQYLLIPDHMTILIAASSFLIILAQPHTLLPRILASLSIALFFISIYLLTQGRGMGMGDIKLAPVLGLLLGWYGWLAVLLSFWVGALIGVTLILSHQATRKTAIPFGPYLIVGFWITLIYGQQIINWYNSLSPVL